MSIKKFIILQKYLAWVDQLSEDIPEKSSFEPQEIVFKICDIIDTEQTPSDLMEEVKQEADYQNSARYVSKLDEKGYDNFIKGANFAIDKLKKS